MGLALQPRRRPDTEGTTELGRRLTGRLLARVLGDTPRTREQPVWDTEGPVSAAGRKRAGEAVFEQGKTSLRNHVL